MISEQAKWKKKETRLVKKEINLWFLGAVNYFFVTCSCGTF